MSGIYINVKELPENCDSCFCYYNPPDSWEKLCSVSQREWYMSDKKPDWCPLFPVPDHGRLIDASDTVKTLCDKGLYMLAEIVSDMPTIIPADKTEECD